MHLKVTKNLFLFALRFGEKDPNSDEFNISKSYVFVTGVMFAARPWDLSPQTTAARIAFLRWIQSVSLI